MRAVLMWSVKVRAAVVAVAVGVLIFGFTQLSNTVVDTLPEFGRTTVEIQTEALGLSAEEVEQLITVPLEQNLLNGVAFLEDIESASLPGLSSVIMTFEPGTDMLAARQVVTERLTQAGGLAGLSQVAKPPQMLQPRSSTSRAAMIRLSSDEQSPIEMSVLARWVIVPRLLGVEGVANVAIWGFRDRQLQVTVDPEELRDKRVALSQVVSTAGNSLEVSPLSYLAASSPGTGGWIETVNQRLHIFHEQAITTPEELAQVPLDAPDGASPPAGGEVLTLGDVSQVVEDHQPLVGDAHCRPPDDGCLLLVVETFPDANTREVASGLDDALETMRPGLGGMEIDTSIYRPAEYIEASFANLGRALWIAGALLVLALIAFFSRWRAVLLVLVVTPLSIVAGALVLYLRGVTVNMMIVAGLVLGLVVVVDDAVIGVQHVARHWRRDGDDGRGTPAWRVVVDATLEMRRPLLYATLIGVAGCVPLLFTTGVSGAFLTPVVLSYLLAVAASLAVAVTVTPALAVLLLTGAKSERPLSALTGVLEWDYARVARRIVSRPGRMVALGAALLAIGLLTLPFLETSLRPSLREGDVLVHVAAEPGTSLSRMDAVMAEAVEDIAAIPGVSNVGAHAGRAVASDQIVNVNAGEIWVNMEASADYEATVAAITSAVDGLPDVATDVMTYSEERVREAMRETAPDELVIRVYGQDPTVLVETAEQVRDAITGIDGVNNPAVHLPPEESTIQVEVDLDVAQDLGVSPGDVRRTASILLSGLTVGNLFDEQKVFDVVVWGRPGIRQSVAHVRDLLIETPAGGYVRLGQVADVRVASSPTVINHHSVMTYRDVVAEVPSGDVGAVAGAVAAAIDDVRFPLEYHAELLGGYEGQAATRTRLLGVSFAAAIAIFLLLQSAFGSWRLAVLAFVCLPAALTGGVVAALVTDNTITLGSAAGLVAVFAIAARTVVVLVTHYQQRHRGNGLSFGPDLVARATAERAAPIIVAPLATAAVFAPLAVTGDAIGFEIVRPMAIVVLGGLITTVVVSLCIVPALYLQFGRASEPDTTREELLAPLPVEAEAPIEKARA